MKFIQIETTDLVDASDETQGFRLVWIMVEDIREIHSISESRGSRTRAKSKIFFRSGSQSHYATDPGEIINAIRNEEAAEVFRRVEAEKGAVNCLYATYPQPR